MNVLGKIAETGILPVIAVPSPEAAAPLAAALVEGGVSAIEVTFRNAWAADAIAAIRAAQPQMAIGAGTILDGRQVAVAKAAGADFVVSPGLDLDIARAADAAGMPYVPGISNPTEITAAVKAGLRTLKFFPAEISGGVAALTLYHGPFPDVRFVPTGGMTFDNIGTYLAKPFVAACGGSWMAKTAAITAGEWAKIAEGCRRSAEIARAAREIA